MKGVAPKVSSNEKVDVKKYLSILFFILLGWIVFPVCAGDAEDQSYYGFLNTGEASFMLFKLEMTNDENRLFVMPDDALVYPDHRTLVGKFSRFFAKETLLNEDVMTIREAFNTVKNFEFVMDEFSRSDSELFLVTKPQRTVNSDLLFTIHKVTFRGMINGSKITGPIRVEYLNDSYWCEGDIVFSQIK